METHHDFIMVHTLLAIQGFEKQPMKHNNKILLFHPPSTTIIETTKKLHSNMLTFSELLVYCLFSFIRKAYKSEFENYILVLRVIC